MMSASMVFAGQEEIIVAGENDLPYYKTDTGLEVRKDVCIPKSLE